MEFELQTLLGWHLSGKKTVLAIVTEAWGSAPRRAGSLMVIRRDQAFEGSVSGGCVESSVIGDALELMHFGGSRHLTFGIADSEAWSVGLACGGTIKVLLLAVDHALAEIVGEVMARLQSGKDSLLEIDMKQGRVKFARKHLAVRQDGDIPSVEGDLLLLPVHPKPRLVIVGAVHIAQHLIRFAIETGFAVTLVDPRGAFTDGRDFERVEIVRDWPDDFLKRRPPDRHTAVVTLTHDPKLDDAALRIALDSPAFYIGALGSRKTHNARLDRLQADGFDGATLARIQGPVGLSIGAATPAEIALSVMAASGCIK